MSRALPSSGNGRGCIRVALVTNIPAPYRVPVFNLLAVAENIELHVFYAARTEPDRNWDLPTMTYACSYLREKFFTIGPNFIHFNPDVFAALHRFDPKVVITAGFSPTYLMAFLYTRLFRRAHIAMTDGTLVSEAKVTWFHRLLRRIVLGRSDAFIVASQGGKALMRRYGAADGRIFFSPLCANSTVGSHSTVLGQAGLDFLFSGRLVAIKNPLFALDVVRGVAVRIGRRMRLGILGAGPLESAIRARAASYDDHVDLVIPGHVGQAEVPLWFARAHVFLFPTSWDPWGVVTNEACQAGVPSIVSPFAGAANELLREGVSALIRPLDAEQWIEAATALTTDASLHSRLSEGARREVQPYNAQAAADGIEKSIQLAALR